MLSTQRSERKSKEKYSKIRKGENKSMKTVLKQTKRFAAVFLAFAMVVLGLPNTAMPVLAAADTFSFTDGSSTGLTITPKGKG